MSQEQMRAMAVMLLHQQAGAPPVLRPVAVLPAPVPVSLPPLPAIPRRWYQRLWAALRAQYDLVGWPDA